MPNFPTQSCHLCLAAHGLAEVGCGQGVLWGEAGGLGGLLQRFIQSFQPSKPVEEEGKLLEGAE